MGAPFDPVLERFERDKRADHELYGNPSDMGELSARLAELAKVPSRIAAAVAADLEALLEQGYRRGRNPYGEPWAPLKRRTLAKHRPPPLTHHGLMREDTSVAPRGGAGVVLSAPFPAGIHMTGAGLQTSDDPADEWGMEARPMFPDGEALPASWQKAIDRRVREAFGKGGRK